MIENFKARFAISEFTGELFFQWYFDYNNKMYGQTRIIGNCDKFKDGRLLTDIQVSYLKEMLSFMENLVYGNKEEEEDAKRFSSDERRREEVEESQEGCRKQI